MNVIITITLTAIVTLTNSRRTAGLKAILAFMVTAVLAITGVGCAGGAGRIVQDDLLTRGGITAPTVVGQLRSMELAEGELLPLPIVFEVEESDLLVWGSGNLSQAYVEAFDAWDREYRVFEAEALERASADLSARLEATRPGRLTMEVPVRRYSNLEF